MIHNLFDSWVDDDYQHDPEFVSKFNTLFKKNLPDLAYKLNLAGWRDLQNLDEFVLKSKHLESFSECVHKLLSAVNNGDVIDQALDSLIKCIKNAGCKANLTKVFPSAFLFLWKPEKYIFIKPWIFDKFLIRLGYQNLGQGKFLTVDEFNRVMSCMETFKEQLSSIKPKNFIDIQSFYFVIENYKDEAEESLSELNEDEEEYVTEESTMNNMPLNMILYGPPGTGKTYKLQQLCDEYFTDKKSNKTKEEYLDELIKDFSSWKVLAAALLDQNLKTIPELMEHPLILAYKRKSEAQNIRASIWGVLQSKTFWDCEHVNIKKRNEPLLFRKTKDSVWSVDRDAVATNVPEVIDLLEKSKEEPDGVLEKKRYSFVTFHQSYSYEDFVEGIRPIMSDEEDEVDGMDLSYVIHKGIFRQVCQKAMETPDKPYALFIDEINRGNVSAIFGELITLIEDDKRGKDKIPMTLPYSCKEFYVPENLYIIGTMNTADRSVEALDTALRRRFSFEEMMPDPTLLQRSKLKGQFVKDDEINKVRLSQLLRVINRRLEVLIDRDHTIGHAFFIKVKSLKELKAVFKDKVIPLLQEYFYGDWSKIGLVLGPGFVREKIDGDKFEWPTAFKTDDIIDDDSKLYEIIPESEWTLDSFKQIAGGIVIGDV